MILDNKAVIFQNLNGLEGNYSCSFLNISLYDSTYALIIR